MVVGLDVHKKKTVGFVVDVDIESGVLFSCETTSEGLRGILPRLAGHKVIIEASTSGKAAARELRSRGVEVDLLHADVLTTFLRRAKTDKLDARDLTRVGMLGGYKTCYIPTLEEEALRTLVRHVHDLGDNRTRLKNQVKAIAQRNLIPEPVGKLDNARVRARWTHLRVPEHERVALESKLRALAHMQSLADEAMIELCSLARKFPAIDKLVALKGVDVYAASVIVAECGDFTRFPTAKKLASYTGLTPRMHQSGDVTRSGRITRSGPSLLRHVLVEAAHTIVRYPGRYRNKYERIKKRRGGKRALVATARSLITGIWYAITRDQPLLDADTPRAEAKKWRYTTIARLAEEKRLAEAHRLLDVSDIVRAHAAWKRGRSRLVT